MLERSVMYAVYKGVAIAASILFMEKTGIKMTNLLILSLVLSCILAANCLVDLIQFKYKLQLQSIIQILLFLLAFVIDLENMFPLIIILMVQIMEHYAKGGSFLYLVGGTFLLMAFIISPTGDILTFTTMLTVLLLYTIIIREQAENKSRIIIEQKEELAFLNNKLADNRRLIKTLQYTAALEERNRLAVRLHDKVGHGISGSIILLEASRLMLDQNPEKAKEGMDKAINNLRAGVDDIRLALREERPVRSELGLCELQTMLEQFQVTHNVKTTLVPSGNTDFIGADIWQCIYENLEEALTNLLKHSNATEFKLTIQVMNKVIKVEYLDDGKSKDKFAKGLGLEAIEERTIKCGGRCFFDKTDNGFRITNIYTY